MKIVAISDLHGQIPEITEQNYDILCICGDIFPLRAQNNLPQCESWLKKVFIPWCESLPCDTVLLIAGNHDLYFERTLGSDIYDVFSHTKIKYLENTSYEINGVTFYGTPYCHEFGNWSFMRSDECLSEIFENIPEDVDVLLTHDAPYGTSDICLDITPWPNAGHIGSIPLRDAILDKAPKLVLHGHLHSTNHNVELMGETDTEVYNVSLLNEEYKMAYPPLILEIKNDELGR